MKERAAGKTTARMGEQYENAEGGKMRGAVRFFFFMSDFILVKGGGWRWCGGFSLMQNQ